MIKQNVCSISREREDRHHILRGIRYTYADFGPVSAEQLYGRQTTVREMNQLLIGMDSNALREFLNPEGADSEKLCQERATEQAYYQGGMLLNELDEDKNPARHYVLGNKYIGLDHNYYLTDEQGSVRYVLDAAGNVQNDYRYDAFGQCIAGYENIPNRLRYNAQIEDDLTGLYYLRARYYNTGIGRFTQEDVIYNDGLNLYAYCGSNPIGYGDWDGYKKQPVPFKMGKYDYSDINSIGHLIGYLDKNITNEEILEIISEKKYVINIELMSTANLMIEAVHCDRFEVAKQLVNMGSDINWKCKASMINGNVLNVVSTPEEAEFFLKNGAEIEQNFKLNISYVNPAIAATQKNDLRMLEYWINKEKILFSNDMNYYNELCMAVVDLVSDINQTETLSYVISNDNLFEMLIENYKNITDKKSIELRRNSLNMIKNQDVKPRVEELKNILKSFNN